MSVRFDASTDGLVRTASVLNYNSPYSWMAWVYASVFNEFPFMFNVHTGSSSPYNTDGAGMGDAASHKPYIEPVIAGTFGGTQGASALTLATWYHMAMVRESVSSLKLYIDGTLVATDTLNITGRTASSRMDVGKRTSSGSDEQQWNGRVAYMRAWQSALTPTEILAEKDSVTAVKASPWGVWPLVLHTDLTDTSGNTRNWTSSGTLTTEADPVLAATAAVGGSGGDGMSEPEVVAGGQVITLTLTGDTFIL
jgi:hypothetical protein